MVIECTIAAIIILTIGYWIGRADEKKKRDEIAVVLVNETRLGMRALFNEELEEMKADSLKK